MEAGEVWKVLRCCGIEARRQGREMAIIGPLNDRESRSRRDMGRKRGRERGRVVYRTVFHARALTSYLYIIEAVPERRRAAWVVVGEKGKCGPWEAVDRS